LVGATSKDMIAQLQNVNKRKSVTTGHHSKPTVLTCILMLNNNYKVEWSR